MSDPNPKAELRQDAELRRRQALKDNPLAGLTLSAWAPRDLVAQSERVVSGYWPFRSEIDPRPLMQRFARAGALLVLPATPAKGEPAPLKFHRWRPKDALTRSAFGVKEPHPDVEVVDPDILLIPLLAFDRRGGRLGYGAGHYDRTLARLRSIKPIQAIGLAFSAQEVEAAPMEAHDQWLDGIITERGFIAAPPRDLC